MHKSKEEAILQGYKDLAHAIVLQAIIDYKESSDNAGGIARRNRIERFIESPYFTELCDINPEWLVRELRISVGDKTPTSEVRKKVISGAGYITRTEFLSVSGKSVKTFDRAVNSGKLKLFEPPVRGFDRKVTADSVRIYLGAKL